MNPRISEGIEKKDANAFRSIDVIMVLCGVSPVLYERLTLIWGLVSAAFGFLYSYYRNDITSVKWFFKSFLPSRSETSNERQNQGFLVKHLIFDC